MISLQDRLEILMRLLLTAAELLDLLEYLLVLTLQYIFRVGQSDAVFKQ